MKTLSPLKAGLFAVLASTAVLTTSVYAEPTHGSEHRHGEYQKGERGNMHGMFKGLELTDAQKADIKKLFAEQKAARGDERPSKEERQAKRQAMQDMITAVNFDEASAKAMIAEQQAQREVRALAYMKMQNQIYNLLTPEQQVKFKARFDAHAGKEPRR